MIVASTRLHHFVCTACMVEHHAATMTYSLGQSSGLTTVAKQRQPQFGSAATVSQRTERRWQTTWKEPSLLFVS